MHTHTREELIVRTIITIPDTRVGRTIAAALGGLARMRPVAVENDNYGHVQGDYAHQIVRSLRISFSDLVWNVAPPR